MFFVGQPLARLASKAAVKARRSRLRGLLKSVPRLDQPGEDGIEAIPGNPPNLLSLPKGCRFRERCPKAHDACSEAPPMQLDEQGHAWRCFLDGSSQ